MRKDLAILGCTGSIGQSTLDVVRAHPDRYGVSALAAGNNVEALAKAAREFSPRLVAIANVEKEAALKQQLADLDCQILSGEEGVCTAMRESGAQMCVSAAMGAAGLAPTLAAIDAGLDIALANKETLVCAGELVTRRAQEKGVALLPVDSEHCAIFQCLGNSPVADVRKIILTASGGPFRGRKKEELQGVTAKEALAHPTWSMGRKITVDSATLANKALEVIEAHWLFSLPYDKIDVLVHPQSLVHGLVEFVDGAVLMQMANADMRLPIAYALSYPERPVRDLPTPDLATLGQLTFEAPDREAFPLLDDGIRAGRAGGTAPAIFSAANEAAVDLFLQGAIGFSDIHASVCGALEAISVCPSTDLETILDADRSARAHVYRRSQTQ